MRRLALIFPVPGIAAMREATFNPAKSSSLSASSNSSESVMEPVLRSSLTSARTLRASAAFSRAFIRCSSVSCGGCAMACVTPRSGAWAMPDITGDHSQGHQTGTAIPLALEKRRRAQ